MSQTKGEMRHVRGRCLIEACLQGEPLGLFHTDCSVHLFLTFHACTDFCKFCSHSEAFSFSLGSWLWYRLCNAEETNSRDGHSAEGMAATGVTAAEDIAMGLFFSFSFTISSFSKTSFLVSCLLRSSAARDSCSRQQTKSWRSIADVC